MIFAAAKNLWLLLLVVGLAVLDIFFFRKRQALLSLLFPGELKNRMLKKWDKRKHLVKLGLFILAIFFLVTALARPQWGKKTEVTGRLGLDIMIAVDVSRSMLAQDVKPNRLEYAKASLALLVEQLSGNRLGLVAFAGSSFVHCPLTTDADAIRIFLKSIDTDLIPDPGTDMGGAIKTCIKAFGKFKNSKVIILLTDGEDLDGSAVAGAELAAKNNIRIFAVGIGSLDGAPIPTADGFKKDEQGKVILSRANPELLNMLAGKTSGRAYSGGFQELFAAVAALPKQKLQHTMAYQHQDRFQIFIFLSLFCLVAEMLISERKDA